MSKSSTNKYHHGDLKVSLLKAAGRLIEEKGPDALSLRSIAIEVGVSHMAPYAHFKNKSELFKSVAADGFLKLEEKLKNMQSKSSKSKDLVLRYGAAYVEFATNNPQLYNLMLSQTHPVDALDASSDNNSVCEIILHEASKRPYVLLKECFRQNEIDEEKINIQAQGAWALVHGISSLIITKQIIIDKKSSIKDFLSIVTQGLKNH